MRRRPWLLAPILWLAVGCADLLEVQYDPVGDVRPSTLVDRLRQDVAAFKATWEPQRKGGYGPVDFQIGELSKAADAMAVDLGTRRGRFAAELEKAHTAAVEIARLVGGRASRAVERSWQPLRATLDTLVSEYRWADAAKVYAREAVPRQTLSPAPPARDDYDASFEIEQIQTRFGTVMKSWEGAPARRREPWAKALDAELSGFSSGLGELARVKSGRRAEVVPAATRLMTRADRVETLVQDHATELPRQFLEEWRYLSGWLRTLKE